MRYTWLVGVGVAALLWAGCSAKTLEVQIRPPSSPFAALIVMPVEVGFAADPGESVRRAHDVLDFLWSETTWRVISPGLFRVLESGGSDLLTSTDLVIRGRDLGFDVQRAAVLAVRVSAREARGQAVVVGGDRPAVGSDYQGQMDVELRLSDIHGASLGVVRVTEKIDPFAERPDYDDLPAARAGIRRALAALVHSCPICVVEGVRPSFDVFANPAPVLDAGDDSGTSLRTTIAAADELEKDRILWRAMQYFRPDISLAEAKRLAEIPPAACVGHLAPAELERGDCIIAAEDQPIVGPHALAWALARDTQVALTIIDTVGSSRIVLMTP